MWFLYLVIFCVTVWILVKTVPGVKKHFWNLFLIFSWLFILIWFLTSTFFVGCEWGQTIVLGTLLIPLTAIAIFYGFAPLNIFFTLVQEGTAKIVVTGGAAVNVLLQYKDHLLDQNWDITKSSGTVQPSPSGLGGLRFFGIWPLHQIYDYPFSWASIDQDGEKKEYRELLDHIMVKDMLYWFTIREAEDKDLVPLNLEGLITVRVKNPYKALFGVQNWLKIVIALIQTLLRGEVSEDVYQKLVSSKKLLGNKIKTDPDAVPLWENLLKEYGIEVIKIEVKDVDPPANYRDMTMQEIISKQRKKATVIDAEAEAERLGKVYSAIEAKGDVGRLVRTLEMLEKSKDKWVISPDILAAVKGLFDIGKKGS